MNEFNVAKAAMVLLALSTAAAGSTFNFNTDPFQGTNVRNTPGRQVVGGELFLSFNTGADVFAFDEAAFGMGNQVHFANGLINAIPSTGVNVVVLQDLDNDANPLTPFGAGNAADLLAGRITTAGPGVFVYFNQSLNLPRLVYSDDLSSNSADLRILARMLNLTGQPGINALPTFSASNFAITGSQTVPEPSGVAFMFGGIALLVVPVTRRLANRRVAGAAAVLLCAAVAHASDAERTNIIDTTSGFTSFGIMPAISNSGAVAFIATGTGYETGAVFRWQSGRLIVIASKDAGGMNAFGETVVVNPEGLVAFNGKVLIGGDTIIGAGDGGRIKVIASASANGLIGGPFLGVGGMNEAGRVVFLAFRRSGGSKAIFQGQGGPLTTVVDTATNTNFTGFGNADINASGGVVFMGFTDTGDGLFTSAHGNLTPEITTNGGFGGFLDPVINNSGTVASASFPNAGGMEVFTVRDQRLNVVSNAARFVAVDNVSVNNSGDVAFFANEANGRDGIFINEREDRDPVPLIETGDTLFGSQVSRLSVGRFSLNDRGQVVFLYGLTDGRSGLAIASRHRDR